MPNSQKRSNKNSKRKNRSRNSAIQVRPKMPANFLSVPTFNNNLIVPDHTYVWLKWTIQKSFSLAVTPAQAFRYRPSAAYDVDPLLGNTALPGLTEWNTFYSSFRVLASRCVVRCANTSTVTMPRLTVIALNEDPTSSPSTSIMTSWWDNSYSKSQDLSLNGGPHTTVANHMTTEKIKGSTGVYFEVENVGNTSNGGIPADNWYWAVGLVAPTTIATAIPATIDIYVGLDFFDRSRLLN